MRLALGGGHSTLSEPVLGISGVPGVSKSVSTSGLVSTPSSTSSGSVLIVCQNNSL